MRRSLIPAFFSTLILAHAQTAFDPANIDPATKPCENFFQYANGTWLKNNPIPGQYSTWGSFIELVEDNNLKLKTILEEASADSAAPEGSVRKKIGDFYASGMDVEAVNKAGVTPLQPEFDRIAALASTKELPALLAHLHDLGVGAGFGFFADQDAKDSSRVIAQFYQGGLGLPDRDYYLKTDDASKKIREQYVEHVAKMFTLLGDKPDAAKTEADTVLAFETQLAEASMTKVEQRDPQAVYHKMTLTEVSALTPTFDQKSYLVGRGLGDPGDFCVGQPDFLKKFDAMLTSVSLENWKTYLRWQLLTDNAGELSDPFVDENFHFFGTILNGTKELKPRWKRVLAATDGALGEATGQLFVEKYFPPEAKQRILDLVASLRATLRTRIDGLAWMGDDTKKAALHKLDKFTVKMGYPDKWRDYSTLQIDRKSYVLNTLRAAQFEIHRNLAKIGKPVDRDEWLMTPQTVNAYYNPALNEIVFPAGILQPPFFSAKSDDAINFGGIGAVIGHEMTHGFDDQGRQFDADGNLKEWWTEADKKAFNERAQKVVDQYGNYTAIDELKLNGQLTQGENIADIGGVRIAWTALQEKWAKEGKPAPIDGFTPEQRFFLGWAQVWRSNIRKEALRMRVLTDPHSPAIHRVNGVVANMPEFFQAFGCDASSPMARKDTDRAAIW
ncbi:MAG: M13 family metallopeptidase [Chthoniobacterales bacterium]